MDNKTSQPFTDNTEAPREDKKSDIQSLSMNYYLIAAEGGNSLGQYNYGTLLYFVEKNNVVAYKWILCSAKQNYSEAIFAKENMKEQNLITKEQIKKAEILSKDC